jgi:CMP-N,N'-diacetyllegionaminic acid synthase
MIAFSIIPARAGSKGIPNKNLQEVGGKKLLEWSIRASLQTPNISRTIVSTDSEEYAEIALSLGAEVPFLRPQEFASDSSPDSDFILHAISKFKDSGECPDFLVHLRPTSPFRNPKTIEAAIKEFGSLYKTHSALRSVHQMSESAYKMLEIDELGHLTQIFTKEKDIEQSNRARQIFPTTYSPNGYVDVISCKYAETERKIHGNKVKAFITENIVEVDDWADLEYLNVSLKISLDPYNRIFGG